MPSRKHKSSVSASLFRAGVTIFVLSVNVAKGWISSNIGKATFNLRSSADPEIVIASMETCLAVVPPDDAWDRLQRARHVARDTSYARWPPAIRLLHPFLRDTEEAALRVAEIIEKENIEPFTIKLDQWSIIPHVEALEMDWEAMRQLPDYDEDGNEHEDGDDSVSSGFPISDEDRAVQELIAREERIGREKLEERQRREQSKQRKKEGSTGDISQSQPVKKDGSISKAQSAKQSGRSLLQKQKQMYEEFNGPTVVVLEPDQESKEKLKNLRNKLIEGLFKNKDERCYFTGAYSPSSTVSETGRLPKSVAQSLDEDSFRPLVPIAAFPTVTSAMETARKLRALWQPLTFKVTDLHLVSSGSLTTHEKAVGEGTIAKEHDYFDNREYLMFHKQSFQSGNTWSGSDEEPQLNAKQFGCDAMVMLVGEEEPMDDELNKEMVKLICEHGISGGYSTSIGEGDNSLADHAGRDKPASDETATKFQEWLLQDDDFDEGKVVVIGRTHFFTGEMRNYVGMPAFSVLDGKRKVLGDKVSGAACGRGTVHQSSSTRGNDDDCLPSTDQQKARKQRNRTLRNAPQSNELVDIEETFENE